MTRLADLRQSGSLKLVLPRTYGVGVEAIIVNTAGGITGGDRYDIAALVGEGTSLTLTTQAAERAYRAQASEVGRVATTLTVEADARLYWLPQEMILFERSALRRRLSIDLAVGARLLMVEPLVFGRAAMREDLRDINFQDRIEITRGGTPLYLDGMTLAGDATTHLARPAIAGGAGAMASLVLVVPDAGTHLGPLRAMLPATAGVSMIADDVLVLRLLARDSFEMRTTLVPVLDRLSQDGLPTSWRL